MLADELAIRLDPLERSVIRECLARHVCTDGEREACRFELENFFTDLVEPTNRKENEHAGHRPSPRG